MDDYLSLSLDSMISAKKNDMDEYRHVYSENSDVDSRSHPRRNSKERIARITKSQIEKSTTPNISPRRLPLRQGVKNLISIKFLISNELSGSMIGPGGSAIKELMDITGARASVSASWETFSGTTDRVMLLTGKPEEVIIAQSLVWDNIALHASEDGFDGRVMWSPKKSHQRKTEGSNDAVVITNKVTIPAAAGGLIIGRSGSTIRSFTERSCATVEINVKGDAEETNERVLVIAGPKKCCCDCLAMIIEKLVEGGCEFSHYDEDHHMSMISNSVPPSSGSSSRTSRDREGKGRDGNRDRERDRISPAGRPPRRVVLTATASRSQSPSARSRSNRERDWDRDKDRETDRRTSHDSDRPGSRDRGRLSGTDRDLDYTGREERNDYRGSRTSSDRTVYMSYSDGNGIAVNSSRPSSATNHRNSEHSSGGYISSHNNNCGTTTTRSRTSSDASGDLRHVHASSSSSSYVDFNPPLGPDFNNSKIQRIVKGSRNNSQAGIPLRTKAQDKSSQKDVSGVGVVEVLSANTTINVAVPDALIGSIFGKQSATLHEIIAFSGAHVVVSPRGQYIEGTSNRLVTITGSPHNAQAAHSLITKALQQGALDL